VLTILKRSVLNPVYTLPLYLYALYTPKGREYALKNPTFKKWLCRLAIASLVRKVNNFLDTGMQNNWKNDSYDWSKEIVVVTGGSDGIGAIVVQLFAEKGIKVVVLDIQAPKYPSTSPTNIEITYPC
jgi:all-trans-retinol dehydrogenase (NAD+)